MEFPKINHLTVNLINEYQMGETPVFEGFRGENRAIPAFRECNIYIIAHSRAKTPQSKVKYSKVKESKVDNIYAINRKGGYTMAHRFNNTTKRPNRLTAEEKWERETTQLRALATSQFGEYCKNRFNVPEVEEAEKAFNEALQQISDPELRNTLDMATGKISYAYEILGFCAGHFAQDSRSRAAFF